MPLVPMRLFYSFRPIAGPRPMRIVYSTARQKIAFLGANLGAGYIGAISLRRRGSGRGLGECFCPKRRSQINCGSPNTKTTGSWARKGGHFFCPSPTLWSDPGSRQAATAAPAERSPNARLEPPLSRACPQDDVSSTRQTPSKRAFLKPSPSS